jgi:hypothetical protein
MGKHWDDFKDRVGGKSVGVGMILIDLVIFVLLAGLVILADMSRDWIFQHLGKGNLFTQLTLITIEIILDLSAIVVVLGWLWTELKELF